MSISRFAAYAFSAPAASPPAAPDAGEIEMEVRHASEPPSPEPNTADPYRGAILVLLAAAFLGMCGALFAGIEIGNPVLVDTAMTLGISTGVLIGVALAQRARATPSATVAQVEESSELEPNAKEPNAKGLALQTVRKLRDLGTIETARLSTAAAGFLAIAFLLRQSFVSSAPSPVVAAIIAAACFAAAGLAATAVRYFADIESSRFPEAAGLCRGARVAGWILVLAGISVGLVWANQQTIISVTHVLVLGVDIAVCWGLLDKQRRSVAMLEAYPLDLPVLSVLGSRANVIASMLDFGEEQLGIDLRSTWALTVVRRTVEPLIIALCFMGWLSTSLTVIAVDEEGLVERLGVPVQGQPLEPGIHLHWPWPVDHVFRIPVRRIQSLSVGHEGVEEPGPENVLWAQEHAANEYTLLLGNGRDLITVDAAVQYRIADARAWKYRTRNPADALRAIAYRTVMRSTVNRTLAEALSENVVTLTRNMRTTVQSDADALGLGVEVMGFTVGGMHPPVMVAPDYQAVVSAELRKVTAVVNAQVYRNQTVPAAEASVLISENVARSEGAQNLGKAAGEAWGFRTLESQYRAAPTEYLFRRRLETLESGLQQKSFTVVDSRFQRDGGELWVIP